MQFSVLASGSEGNATYIESANTRVLIDAGLPHPDLEARLRHLKIDPGSIAAIVLTHAHSDHIRGAGAFAHKYRIPIYGDWLTLDRLTLKPGQNVIHIVNREFMIDDIQFTAFALSHDCQPTYGYLIESGGSSIAVCTDLGMVTPGVKSHLSRANALVIEANHDPELLMRSSEYSWKLKQRIAGIAGHLSNFNTGELLANIFHSGIRRIILAHLSKKANIPELALRTVLDFIGDDKRPMVELASQDKPTPLFSI